MTRAMTKIMIMMTMTLIIINFELLYLLLEKNSLLSLKFPFLRTVKHSVNL